MGGVAVRRPNGPLFGPWGRWFPLYSLGYGYGYTVYDPWLYGSTRWIWGRYGLWYDPYDPYGYDGYYGGYYGGGYYGGGGGYSSSESAATGSIRLKANVDSAKVYIDGTLMGTVDDFDGLTGHLVLAGGPHQLELRADGYETYSADITVAVGKTTTERVTLKKKK